MHATTLDLRAVGWVLTRDALAEVLRAKLGGARRIDDRVLRSVATQWRALALGEANRSGPNALPRVPLTATPLSTEGAEKLAEILREVGARWPAQYGVPALRRRTLLTAAQSAIGFAVGLALTGSASAASPTLGAVALVMITMGLWSMAVATQLARTLYIATAAMRTSVGDAREGVQTGTAVPPGPADKDAAAEH